MLNRTFGSKFHNILNKFKANKKTTFKKKYFFLKNKIQSNLYKSLNILSFIYILEIF